MKRVTLVSLSLVLSIALNAQIPGIPNNDGIGIAKHTDKKFYIINGKVTDVASNQSDQKAMITTDYINYFDVEYDGYGFSDDNAVPRFYAVMDDSNYTTFGTAFTHTFDYNTFDLEDFADKNWWRVDELVLDSVTFNFGHVNNSGVDNILAVTLKTLPVGNAPSANGAIIWSDTILSKNFTPGMGVNLLPSFAMPVGETLSYANRGVFLEIYFDGVVGLDSGSFLFNFWDPHLTCSTVPPTAGIQESFTYREDSLLDGRAYYKNPALAIANSMPTSTYFTNFSIYKDCNSNAVYDLGTGEAYPLQNISLGLWYSTEIIDGIDDLNSTSIKVYPNPTQRKVSIHLNKECSELEINVTGIDGKSVQKLFFEDKSKIEINLPETEGMYFIRVSTNEGQFILKVIKD